MEWCEEFKDQALPDIKLKIEGFKEKQAEEEVSDGLVEVKESEKKADERSGKKNKGRIHEVRYMDFDNGVDELESDDDVGRYFGNDAEEDNSDEDIKDDGVEKAKKRKTAEKKAKKMKNAEKLLSELNGEKKAKKLKSAEKQKKSKLSLKDGKKTSEVGKKLKDGPAKSKIRA